MVFDKEKDGFLYYFEQISAIPRESGNEKAVSDYIKEYFENAGLLVWQHPESYALIIEKEASLGCESADPVVLQAHMDMVCEKTEESVHDFMKDPVLLSVDGDFVRSATGTSLGADDGIGMAYCLALLDSNDICHPRLQVVLTTQEETTFDGISSIRAEQIQASRVINIDHCSDCQMVVGSCGGTGVSVEIPVMYELLSAEKKVSFEIAVTGMSGGHSGEDIHLGRGSAIQIMTRILRDLYEKYQVKLSGFFSGTNRLAISRESTAVIMTEEEQAEAVQTAVLDFAEVLKREYHAASPEMNISVRKIQSDGTVIGKEDFKALLQLLSLTPDGLQKMNGMAPGIVESSLNLGVLKVSKERVYLEYEVRGAYESTISDICEKLRVLAELFGGHIRFFDRYAPWECKDSSVLQEMAKRVYERVFEEKFETIVLHAGLECGFFSEMNPETDAISIGPDCWNFHSPEEVFSISSAKKTWRFLVELLKEMTR